MTSTHIPVTVPDLLIRRPDGRRVAADVTGPRPARPVLLCHPAPGSRRLDPDPVASHVAGVALVTVDRPGYGASDPMPGGRAATVAEHAADAAAVLDQLATGPVPVIGWSAGGRVALALAATRPDLVDRVVIAGTPAPDDQVPWYGDEIRSLTASLAADPDGATAVLTAMLGGVSGPAAVAAVAGDDADATALASDGVLDRVAEMMRVAEEQGAVGLAGDIAAYTLRPWGFDPGDVTAPVDALYGAADAVVGPEHGRWWVSVLPHARLLVVEGAGHLALVRRWGEVLGRLGAVLH